MNGWAPLRDSALVASCQEAISMIASDLQRLAIEDNTLMYGRAGLALLYTALNENQWLEAIVEQVFSQVNTLPRATLYYGFVGVAFLLQHLKDTLDTPEETLDEFDHLIAEHLLQWEGDFELLDGLVGVGVYALERSTDAATQILSEVLSLLEDASSRTSAGLSWFSRAAFTGPALPSGAFNLGMPHGLPGVISFLSSLVARGVHASRSAQLLRGAVSELLSKELAEGFPLMLAAEIGAPRVAPPTWSYGDAGISLSLWRAARAIGEQRWEREALRIAHRAAQFDPKKIKSAALCQGTAGTALIFLRLHQYTGQPLFYDAALRWFSETLSRREPGKGIGGFHSLVHPRFHPLDETGFLTGAAGIAMALHAAISDAPPDWDRLLLLS